MAPMRTHRPSIGILPVSYTHLTIELLTKLQFDLVLLDLRLPDIGGHEIMDFINARGIDTKVIVLLSLIHI